MSAFVEKPFPGKCIVDGDFTIRKATFEDSPRLLELIKCVGCFIQLDEIHTYMQVDPEGIIVAEIPANDTYTKDNSELYEHYSCTNAIDVTSELGNRFGKIIGCCSGIKLGPNLGFVGLLMVHENYRNHGIGKLLFERSMERLQNLNIGIKCLAGSESFAIYTQKYGFKHIADYLIAIYTCVDTSRIRNSIKHETALMLTTFLEGKLQKHYCDAKKNCTNSATMTCPKEGEAMCTVMSEKHIHDHHNFNISSKPDAEITESFTSEIIDDIVDYDRRLHKRDRSFIVRQTLSWKSCRSAVATNEFGSVVGYGCLRQVVNGHWLISPLYADSEDIAEVLVRELLRDFDMSQAPKGVLIRCPLQEGREEFLERLGFYPNGIQIATAYKKTIIDVEISRIYSFHSSAFCNE